MWQKIKRIWPVKMLRAINVVLTRRRQADERWQRTDSVSYHIYYSKLLSD